MPSKLPIILAHGICPFDRVLHPISVKDNAPDDRFHYFRKIRSTLIDQGFSAYHTRVSWAASLDRRASDLHRQLLDITDNFTLWPAVHIMTHSMGGLDARMMIYRYRMERRVLSLTTIGTPHHGTAYADWGIRHFRTIIPMARCLGINLDGLMDLTRERCRKFNLDLKNFEKDCGVAYRTVAGVQNREKVFPHLRRSYRIIYREEGENDGLVSVRSALWKEDYFLGKIKADHLNLIGWWHRHGASAGMGRKTFERAIQQFYIRLARGLERYEK